MEHVCQDSGHSIDSARIQGAFEQLFHTYDLKFVWSCMEPGVVFVGHFQLGIFCVIHIVDASGPEFLLDYPPVETNHCSDGYYTPQYQQYKKPEGENCKILYWKISLYVHSSFTRSFTIKTLSSVYKVTWAEAPYNMVMRSSTIYQPD